MRKQQPKTKPPHGKKKAPRKGKTYGLCVPEFDAFIAERQVAPTNLTGRLRDAIRAREKTGGLHVPELFEVCQKLGISLKDGLGLALLVLVEDREAAGQPYAAADEQLPQGGELSRLVEGLDGPVGFDLSRKEVLTMKIPPKVWITAQGKKGLFRRPDLVNLHGAPFAGKTELMKALAVPLTQGGDFFGYEVTEPGGIFWANLDTEWDDTQEMYQAWPKKVGDMIHVTNLHPADLKGGFGEWLDHFRRSQDKRKWTVAVIDTMAQLIRKGPQGQSIDEFKRGEVTDFLTPLRRRLNELRVMGIILNHPRKPQMGDAQIEMPSTGSYGSVAFGAMVDMTMRMRRHASGDVVLDWQGRRRPNGRIDLHWNDETRKFEQLSEQTKVFTGTAMRGTDDDILDALRGSDKPMTGLELAEAVGKPPRYIADRLKLLRKDGRVVIVGKDGRAARHDLPRRAPK